MTPCPECVRCAEDDCDQIAHCLSEPGTHDELCDDHRIAADIRAAFDRFDGDPFRRDTDDPDPWGPLAAEARLDNDRFWSTVGDRSHLLPKKDAS